MLASRIYSEFSLLVHALDDQLAEPVVTKALSTMSTFECIEAVRTSTPAERSERTAGSIA